MITAPETLFTFYTCFHKCSSNHIISGRNKKRDHIKQALADEKSFNMETPERDYTSIFYPTECIGWPVVFTQKGNISTLL